VPEAPALDGRRLIEQAEAHHQYCRAEFGVDSMRTMDAWHALCQAYVKNGTRIDALRHHIADEWERFQSFLIEGVDGHVFWASERPEFYLNGESDRPKRLMPVYYWWFRLYGEKPYRLVHCATSGCVSPYHARKEDARVRERIFSDEAIIGALQVWAMQHGRSPGKTEWDDAKLSPSTGTIHKRFGGFEEAVIAAGLKPRVWRNRPLRREQVLEHMYLVAKELGRWPDHDSYRRTALGRYATPTTVRAHFGSFKTARDQARALYSL
jgi:hypothetical protein